MIELEGVSMYFGGIHALEDVDLKLEGVGIQGLIGPNGSGKSTLINVVTGYYKPTKGKVLLNGREISGLSPYDLVRLGITRTFQNPRIFNGLSVLENVMVGQHSLLKSGFWASALKRRFTRAEERAAREEAMKLLYLVGLHEKAHLQGNSLAYGELRRLELARALASNASVLLLDEPAAGMNETETVMLMSLVKQVAGDRHISVLLVEHNMTAVMNYSRTISVLDQGKKIAEGIPEEIKNDCRVIESYMGRRNRQCY